MHKFFSILFSCCFLLVSTSVSANETERFCKPTDQANLEVFFDIYQDSADLQLEVSEILANASQRNLPTLEIAYIEQQVVAFNAAYVTTLGSSTEGLIPFSVLSEACYDDQVAGFYSEILKSVCDSIDGTLVSGLKDMLISVNNLSAYVNHLEKKSGTLKRLSRLDTTGLESAISRFFVTCKINPESTEEEEDEEIPGICTASPTEPVSRFLYKPVSEGNGNLVVLTNPATVVTVDGDNLIDSGASNGYCSTLRAPKTGCSYGKNVVVTLETINDYKILIVADGCKRYECQAGLYDGCTRGVEIYESDEADSILKKHKKLKKKIRKLKKKFREAGEKKVKKKLRKVRKKFKKLKSIVKIFKLTNLF